MRNEGYMDKLLYRIDKEEVIKRFKTCLNPTQVAKDMNCSEDWVKDVVAEYEFEQEQELAYLTREAEYENQVDWAEEHGAVQDENGDWII
jgi:intein-encoded DNA endonuclease-like protein